MTPLASISGVGSEFDAFLFAQIGEDRNGMSLSVVSVLARGDLDPWQEAAKLAALPEEQAVARLAPLLATLSARTLQQTSPEIAAARLLALLPRRTTAYTPMPVLEPAAAAAAHPRISRNTILIAIYMILSLAIQLFVARNETLHVPATPAAPSQPPLSTPNK